MNPVEVIQDTIERIVRANTDLDAAFPVEGGWIDYGAPLSNGPFPCIRINSLEQVEDKRSLWNCAIRVYSQDMTHLFFDLPTALKRALDDSDQLVAGGYLHQPQDGLNCAVIPVTFAA